MEDGKFSREGSQDLHDAQLHNALKELKDDLTVADFLRRYFAGPKYHRLRHSIEQMVEGYDAADPERASTLALREEWMGRDDGEHGRIAEGYGALVEYLASECRRHGATIHLGAVGLDPDVLSLHIQL